MSQASKHMEKYFEEINKEVLELFDIASEAKKKNFDPDEKVTIPLAKNMAERVEGLISTIAPQIINSGIVERIQELEKQYGSQDWRVALIIAGEVAEEKFCKFENKKQAIEIGIRIGFAYVTVGVVASPLEGFVELKLNKRKDNNKEYFCLMYSGPIRSAGGTGASISVLIADYVRKRLGYDTYDPTDKEIKRAYTELNDYNDRITNLQYFPSEEEVEFLMNNLPVQINGDGSEKIEVSNYKDLQRIESNRIRNGFCLVMAECLSLKAPKVWKRLNQWGKEMNLEHWSFMEEFVNLQKKMKAKSAEKGKSEKKEIKIKPDGTFIKDLVAGRPVFTYPLRKGGFRLRYGRSRTSGFSSDSIHPATMVVSENFMAIGTQMKTERPGKSTTFTPCERMDGPIVKLKNGSVKKLEDLEIAKKYVKEIDEIIYLGDILINQGDFSDRGHKLIPCGFVEEWWVQYIEKYMKDNNIDFDKLNNILNIDKENLNLLFKDPIKTKLSFEQAKNISEKLKVPLHPRFIYYWDAISPENFLSLFKCLKNAVLKENKIIISEISEIDKLSLETIGVQHNVVSKEYLVIENQDVEALKYNLGYFKKVPELKKTTLEMINSVCDSKVKDKLGYFIGGRMGRPEKAKLRKLKGSPQVLFPVGNEGGRMKSFQAVFEKGKIKAEFPNYFCEKCNKETIYRVCEDCGEFTKLKYYCRRCRKEMDSEVCEKHGNNISYKRKVINFDNYFNKALAMTKSRHYPELIKGLKETLNKNRIPEHPLKGILRAKNNLYVNKDGTIRYDMTEMTITHFKPYEIGVSVNKLKELGYNKDCYGNDLVNEKQIVELKAQDIILPACKESPDEGADEVLFRTCKFIDDLLVMMYELKPYYNLNSKKDLIGQLCVAMSPHTSAGIICRIVGFSNTQGFFAHPLLHSIMRRDCDGDEAAVMLLLDTLLNFSKKYLPNTRGATQDAPLVFTSRLIPSEVDDMVFNMDVAWKYPLEFYEAAEDFKNPWDVKIEKFEDRLNTEGQYEGLGFTHDNGDFNNGVRCSSYKTIPTMKDKVLLQMELSRKIRAVDEDDVARLVIERHFIRDIKGNLRKFSQQSFRCVKCNEIYRRPPLKGRCLFCNGKIIFTISEGSIVKYLDPALMIAEEYNLPIYLKQTLELLKNRIESVFGKCTDRQECLDKWF